MSGTQNSVDRPLEDPSLWRGWAARGAPRCHLDADPGIKPGSSWEVILCGAQTRRLWCVLSDELGVLVQACLCACVSVKVCVSVCVPVRAGFMGV